MKHEDLTGQRFGRLVAIEYKHCSTWMCRCDCGNEKPVSARALKSGATLSCGCYQIERMKENFNRPGRNRKHLKTLITHPGGKLEVFKNLEAAAYALNLTRSQLVRILGGEKKIVYQGYTVELQ
jgi:hypothetical protein